MSAGVPLGPYLLLRRLAKGGMAEIFLARKEGPEGFARELVVKRILPHLSEDPELMAMFREEARLVARLSHPNVVHVYDFGEVGGTAYLVMELVRGVDLRALTLRAREHALKARRWGAIPSHHAAKILSFVCEGLAHAHALEDARGRPLGLVHRDVTPSNVLLSFEGAVKVADFGIAKLQRGRKEITRVGMVRGKYAYLSPEQARGEPLDRRSDLYNVGVLLFEALTGDTVFPHDDSISARHLAAGGVIPNPERLEMLPPGLREITRRALSARREDRYPDALALRADLERFLRAVPEPSDTVELGRYVQRLFPDVIAEDRRGARAAGTVPLTSVAVGGIAPPVLAGTAPLTSAGDGGDRTDEQAVAFEPNETPAEGVVDEFPDLRDEAPTLIAGRYLGASSAVAAVPRPLAGAPPSRPTPGGLPSPTVMETQRLPATPSTPAPAQAHRWWPALLLLIGGAALGVMLWMGGLRLGDDAPPEAPVLPSEPLATPPLAPPAPRPSFVRVRTEPIGLVVRVDGEERGVAPLRARVEPGVRLLSASRDGRVLVESTVDVPAGEDLEVVLRAEAPEEARLRVVSEPSGALVHVGGERFGRTPLDVALEPGEHEVSLTLDGHLAHEASVAVSPGGLSTLSVRLAPLPQKRVVSRVVPRRGSGTLSMATTPWCEVWLGSRKLGTTPFANVTLPAGTHQLSLRAPGRPARAHRVVIRDGEETRVRLAL